MNAKTSLDRKISTFKEYIKRWEETIDILHTYRTKRSITEEVQSRFYENIDWCSTNYVAIEDAETQMETTWPDTGVKQEYPVIWDSLCKFQFLETPTSREMQNLKTGYLSLKAVLGHLENRKRSIGEIKIEEYEKLKSLIERLKLEYSMIDSLIELAESSEFLGLGSEWILSTIALQLQEAAIILVAKQLGIELDKPNVSKILGRKFKGDVPFKDRYMAFCEEIKRTKDTTLPILPTDLRGMRARVLHEGISPQTNEAKLLSDFTCSFLKDLYHVVG